MSASIDTVNCLTLGANSVIEDAPILPAAGHLVELMAHMNACLDEPTHQTIGSFAETLQTLHAELALMAGQQLGDEVYDWDLILASAPEVDNTDQQVSSPFSAEQLAILTVSAVIV